MRSTLDAVNKSYKIPHDGIIRVLATNAAAGDGYFVISTTSVTQGTYDTMLIYSRDFNKDEGNMQQSLVNKDETIYVFSKSNKTVFCLLYIPFKDR